MRAKKENVEAIKRSVRRAAKKDQIQGLYTAVGCVTVYAGSPMERSFTESQLKEIFKEAMNV